ncbi:MAG TPA: glycosyltransferase family 2 protein [Bacteroidales bacterium]|nr:glycosyltransferase family 2 protein [Bacteroidales bacterium]
MMMHDSSPLVSIGVPVYNGEKYLSECLASILAQTYANWECFVINNQSTDRTPEIAEEYSRKDPRLKVVTNPEFVDMTTNFNNTIKPINDSSKYFKVVCADDWLFPEYLEKTVALMEKNPGAGFCSSYRIDGRKVSCQGLNIMDGSLFNGKDILRLQLMDTIDITGSETTVLYRMEALKRISTFPVIYSYSSYHFDTTLAFELLSMYDVAFVFQVLSFTRRHEETYTSKYVDRFRTSLNFREQELHRYRSEIPGIEKEYKTIRAYYGLYLLKCKLKGDTKSLDWHDKHLHKDRRFTMSEYVRCLWYVLIFKINYKLKGKKA